MKTINSPPPLSLLIDCKDVLHEIARHPLPQLPCNFQNASAAAVSSCALLGGERAEQDIVLVSRAAGAEEVDPAVSVLSRVHRPALVRVEGVERRRDHARAQAKEIEEELMLWENT